MTAATLSTHVLDVSLGKPAQGVTVRLGNGTTHVTDATGRIADLTGGGIEPGRHQLVFDLSGYFGSRPHLFRKVSLDLSLDAGHTHVPLLISPYGCSSYRGS